MERREKGGRKESGEGEAKEERKLLRDNLIIYELLLFFLRDTVLKPPYVLAEQPNELHHTYLDTVGRKVVVARKQNLVEQHIQDFEVREGRMSWLSVWLEAV